MRLHHAPHTTTVYATCLLDEIADDRIREILGSYAHANWCLRIAVEFEIVGQALEPLQVGVVLASGRTHWLDDEAFDHIYPLVYGEAIFAAETELFG